MISESNFQCIFEDYVRGESNDPFFVRGDSLTTLRKFSSHSFDSCLTSPPYWGKRQYITDGIGLEETFQEYIRNLVEVFQEVHRVLRPTGSLWLNIGDSYLKKELLGIPWRVAFALIDEQGWVLRNSVIWNKVKGGPDNTRDRLRNVHEIIFHFVKKKRGYYYNVDAIRTKPQTARIRNGAVISATGVSGVRYKRQIELSTELSYEEKELANRELDAMLHAIREGKITDFRMIIRGQHRVTHSDSEKVSGRARELADKGFYFLKYHPNGSKPSDVWDILPVDSQKRKHHFAPFPEDLCKIPILATCPPQGLIIDPFCGTGTTSLVAKIYGRKSVGIDISKKYLEIADKRCMRLL